MSKNIDKKAYYEYLEASEEFYDNTICILDLMENWLLEDLCGDSHILYLVESLKNKAEIFKINKEKTGLLL